MQFLSGAAGMGFTHSKKEVFTIVEAVLASKGKAQSVSSRWWESFTRRHPHHSIRKAEKLSNARSQATDPIVLDNYYDLLERTLEEYDLLETQRVYLIVTKLELAINICHSIQWQSRGNSIQDQSQLETRRMLLCWHVLMLQVISCCH